MRRIRPGVYQTDAHWVIRLRGRWLVRWQDSYDDGEHCWTLRGALARARRREVTGARPLRLAET
jgi:hypothetical protein